MAYLQLVRIVWLSIVARRPPHRKPVVARVMAVAMANMLTAVLLSIDVLSALENNVLESQHRWRFQSELWNGRRMQAPERSPTDIAFEVITVDRRKAVNDEDKRWPNATVPYVISSSVDNLSSKARSVIREAMNYWEKETCIRFVSSDSKKEKHIVVIEKGNWCNSIVGRNGGRQSLKLALRCLNVGTVLHELGHAIGWEHEHQRPDRDTYVKIVSEKIAKDSYQSYAKYDNDKINTFGVPYDYRSIMHYPGSPNTIRAVDPSMQLVMGQRFKLSFYDLKLANLMYKCAERNKCNVGSTKCTGEGYVGPKCTCVCRDGGAGCDPNSRSNSPVLRFFHTRRKIKPL